MAQDPEFDWAKRVGSTDDDYCIATTIDKWGNVYNTGSFKGTVDLDPGPGVSDFTATSINGNAFVLKLDALGNFIWAKQFSGGEGKGRTIKCDAQGNVYTAGYFFDVVDFDPGAGNYSLSVMVGAFISKLDTDGNFEWAKQLGGETMSIFSITVDAGSNVFCTGLFSNTTDLDPGPGTAFFDGGTRGESQIFILKLTLNGDFVWAKHMVVAGNGNPGGAVAAGNAIVTDNAGNIFVGGYFHHTVDFDPGPGVYNLTAPVTSGNGFILKLNAAGNFVWVKRFGKTTGTTSIYLPYDVYVRSLAVDNTGNILTTGYFRDTIDFDPGPGVQNFTTARYLTGSTYYYYTAGFVSCLDANGDYKWAHMLGDGTGIGSATPYGGITTDTNGDVYAMGTVAGTVDFDPGAGSNNITSNNGLFIVKYTGSGGLVWAKTFGEFQGGYQFSICVDDYFNIYTAGHFSGTVDFDPGAGDHSLTSAGSSDVFIQKLRQCLDSSSSVLNAAACNTYSLNEQTFTTSGRYTQIIPNHRNCDSMITLLLTIRGGGSNASLDARACSSYTWRGHTYYASGVYADTLSAGSGCDSILTLQLAIDMGSEEAASKTICEGEAYLGHTTAGVYTDTLQSIYGCDSIINLDLTVNSPTATLFTGAICPGENYAGYTIPGHYIDTLVSVNGCDSIRTIHLAAKEECIPFIIPNAFTPDNNGRNDLFRPVIQRGVRNYHMQLYNRYGEKVFESNNHLQGWDGTLKGKPQVSGVYIYHIYFENNEGKVYDKKGTVVLIR